MTATLYLKDGTKEVIRTNQVDIIYNQLRNEDNSFIYYVYVDNGNEVKKLFNRDSILKYEII
ncbi:hypothetical protein [Mammaliicoccus lentus]|uniref:hypothetical protein n=1 Tax=Mammaliicoccus lentus TaxID=42858 RepID=UPI001072D6D3|nr:hypothetical protein [Mammaliicoccus lentus]MBF0750453.1 hypothetical protein [Mammaliicoccus lentus]TFU56497.1 hypothetical protein E4T93_13805 [Mammaliicoccus lentus]